MKIASNSEMKKLFYQRAPLLACPLFYPYQTLHYFGLRHRGHSVKYEGQAYPKATLDWWVRVKRHWLKTAQNRATGPEGLQWKRIEKFQLHTKQQQQHRDALQANNDLQQQRFGALQENNNKEQQQIEQFLDWRILNCPVSFVNRRRVNLIHIWQVSPQLSCGDTCQMWTSYSIANMHLASLKN